MATRIRLFTSLAAIGALGCVLALTPLRANAQTLDDDRNDIHDLGTQVGVVTSVSGRSCWIRLPKRGKVGEKVDMLSYSDGTKPLAVGKIEWVSPVSPYEAYVTKVEATSYHFSVNDNDDIFAVGTVFNKVFKAGPQPEDHGFSSYFAAGFYARTKSYNFPNEEEGVDPARALIAELRHRKNKTAQSLADAAEKALGPEQDPGEMKEPQDYSDLFFAVRPYRVLKGMDTVTQHILERLYIIARDSNPKDNISDTSLAEPSRGERTPEQNNGGAVNPSSPGNPGSPGNPPTPVK